MDAHLAPGEQIEVTLRPHPLAWGWHYLAALWPALWAGILWFWFRSDAWQAAPDSAWERFWSFLYGNGTAAGVYTVAGVLAAGLAVTWVRRRPVWMLPYAVAGAAAVTLAAIGGPARYDLLLPALLAPWSVLGLAWVEVTRQDHAYQFTNLRIRHLRGVPQRIVGTIPYNQVADVDMHQGPVRRVLDMATVVPVPMRGDAPVRLVGVRPASKVRELVRAMVDRFAETPYAAGKKEMQQRMEDAIAALRPRRARARRARSADMPQ